MEKRFEETQSPKGEMEKRIEETQSPKGEMEKRKGEMKSEIAGAAAKGFSARLMGLNILDLVHWVVYSLRLRALAGELIFWASKYFLNRGSFPFAEL